MPTRLFIAIDLPEHVQRRLGRLLPEPADGVKPVRPEQLHLTLHFVGDVADEATAGLATSLVAIHQPGFAIDLAGGGCFPAPRRPNVLWIGVEASPPLDALHAAVAEVIAEAGLSLETRPFMPHITLARVSRRLPAGWVDRFLAAAAGFSAPEIPVTTFTLYASERTNNGAVHTVLKRYPLL